MYRGISLIRKRHPTWDNHRVLGIHAGLLFAGSQGVAHSYEPGTPVARNVETLINTTTVSTIKPALSIATHETFMIPPPHPVFDPKKVVGPSLQGYLSHKKQHPP